MRAIFIFLAAVFFMWAGCNIGPSAAEIEAFTKSQVYKDQLRHHLGITY